MKTLMKTFIMTALLGLSYQAYAVDQCNTPIASGHEVALENIKEGILKLKQANGIDA